MQVSKKASARLSQIIRVDHAGELGANRIYAGQLAVFGKNHKVTSTIQHMWDQEKIHKAKMDDLVNIYRVRPTALVPIWNIGTYVYA